MKRFIIVIAAIVLGTMAASAQSKEVNTQLDTTAVLLLQRISEHTGQCYKLYKTENMWTFLELETFYGRIWQVQYSVDDSKATRIKSTLAAGFS